MDNQPQTPAAEQPQQPQEQTPAPEPQLPSEQNQEQNNVEVPQELAEQLANSLKDGMIAGKFKTVDDMLKSYQELEAKYANARREIKGDAQQQEQRQQTAQKQQEVLNEILPKFVENGMQLTEDLLQKATEAGLDPRDVKLKAYEVKEMTQKAYSVVGGEQNYKEMLEWAKEALPQDKKVEFDKGLASPMSEYAIKGLYGEFQKAKSDGSYDRLRGNPAPTTAQGYASRAELYRDKSAAEQAKMRGDDTLWKKYQEKLNLTPRSVLGI